MADENRQTDCGCYVAESGDPKLNYDIIFCALHANAGKLREALEQCRTLISTMKHRDSVDRAGMDAAIDLTMHKIDKALS